MTKNSPKIAEKKIQRFNGIVVSHGKMTKTISVLVERLVWHKKLHKQYRRSKKYLVHDEKMEAQTGDSVVIEKCSPVSANKNHRLLEITKAALKNDEGESV